MARRVLLKSASSPRDVGERLLTSKLQILSGTGPRRPSLALSILTGRVAEQLSILENFFAEDPAVTDEPLLHVVPPASEPLPELPEVAELRQVAEPPQAAEVAPLVALVKPHLLARTVYLTETHLRDIDAIIDAWQPTESRRLTRSAVLRRAIEHLRTAVEADPVETLLESN